MKKGLATLAVAIACAGAVTSNAYALTINDPYVLGIVKDAVPFSDASTVTYINTLLSQPLNSGPTTIGTEAYTRNSYDPVGDSGSVSLSDYDTGTGTTVESGWEYLIAKYDGPNGGAVVFYLGGAAYTLPVDSFDIWTNKSGQGYGLSGWKVFNSVTVPDGGSTLTLFGSALFVFAMLRRRIDKS